MTVAAELNPRVRYVWLDRVARVAERELTVGGRKSADGSAEMFVESAGWYVQVGNFAFNVGGEAPLLTTGDVVKITLERVK